MLVAVGRRPNLEGLNVEASGVDLTDHGGVITDDHLRSTVPNVWALGDVRGKHQFTYIAYDDYRIVASCWETELVPLLRAGPSPMPCSPPRPSPALA